MDKTCIVIFIIAVIMAIVIFLLVFKKREGYKFTPSREEYKSIGGRPIVSTQDNCASCTTKYTKYAHNIPLNSDGQYII